MLCDECGSNAAHVHMIKILNGVKSEKQKSHYQKTY